MSALLPKLKWTSISTTVTGTAPIKDTGIDPQAYNGRWVYIPPKKVPPGLLNLPPDFRHVPPGHQHITHGQLKKNWKTWEKEKYWDRHGGKEWHGDEKWEHNQGKGRGKGRHDD